MIFLVNENGSIIEDLRVRKLIPEYDLVIGEITYPSKNIIPCAVTREFYVGDDVYNIGFPANRSLVNYKFKMEGDQLIVENINVKSYQEKGNIDNILERSIESNDVNIENKTVIKLTYTSELGFSGGPLIQKASNKVVGMMSFLIPEAYDPRKSAIAIRISDIMQFLD